MGFYDPYDETLGGPLTLEEDEPRHQARHGDGFRFFDVVSVGLMLASVAVVVLTVLLINNPQAAFNPFPPAAPTATPTLIVMAEPPTATPAAPTEIPTSIPTPTDTPTPFPTPTEAVQVFSGPTNTPSRYPFNLLDDEIAYQSNENGEGCAWLSIAGQALDLNGQPALQLAVQVRGEGFEWIEFTGSEPRFGEAGFEVLLNTTPVVGEYEVQLFSTTGITLSEPIIVRTTSSCNENVAYLVFAQNYDYTR